MGDFNWITPSFLAFASPQYNPVHVIPPSSPLYAHLPKTVAAVKASKLPIRFQSVLMHFASRGVGLVVRLNSALYSPSYFTALGMNHIDMIFDDGTCPPLRMVKRFIRLAHETITNRRQAIAVHCKAGLGRTGCLIGAYLIYRYGFTANETIAYMRFTRPGMVVGPQQHWLHLNQGTFREWWWEDAMKEKLAAVMPSTPTRKPRSLSKGMAATPPDASYSSSKRSPLGEVNYNESSGSGGHRHSNQDDALPAPTPGQPRKTAKMQDRYHRHVHTISLKGEHGQEEEEEIVDESSRMVSMRQASHVRRNEADQDDNEAKDEMMDTKDEWEMSIVATQRISSSPSASSLVSITGSPRSSTSRRPRSPVTSYRNGNEYGRRAVSCAPVSITTASMTENVTTSVDVADGDKNGGGGKGEEGNGYGSDIENHQAQLQNEQRQRQRQQQMQHELNESDNEMDHTAAAPSSAHQASAPASVSVAKRTSSGSAQRMKVPGRIRSGSGAGRLGMNHQNSKTRLASGGHGQDSTNDSVHAGAGDGAHRSGNGSGSGNRGMVKTSPSHLHSHVAGGGGGVTPTSPTTTSTMGIGIGSGTVGGNVGISGSGVIGHAGVRKSSGRVGSLGAREVLSAAAVAIAGGIGAGHANGGGGMGNASGNGRKSGRGE